METAGFASTRWSVVLAAQATSQPGGAEALAFLCQVYWPMLYAYVRRRGYSIEDSQDLTQAFFSRLLEKQYLGQAQRERGRFRAFLFTAFKNFLANEWDRQQAQKRGGGVEFLSRIVGCADRGSDGRDRPLSGHFRGFAPTGSTPERGNWGSAH